MVALNGPFSFFYCHEVVTIVSRWSVSASAVNRVVWTAEWRAIGRAVPNHYAIILKPRRNLGFFVVFGCRKTSCAAMPQTMGPHDRHASEELSPMRGGCIVTPTRRRNSLPHSFVLCEIARSGPPSLNPPLLASPGTPGDAPYEDL